MSHWDLTGHDDRPAQLQHTHSYEHLLWYLKLEALKTFSETTPDVLKQTWAIFYFLYLFSLFIFFMEDYLYSFFWTWVYLKNFQVKIRIFSEKASVITV
jgi:hypothetical protein